MSTKRSKDKVAPPREYCIIQWVDSWYDDDTHRLDLIHQEGSRCELFSIGWKVGEDDEVIKLAMDFGEGTCRHTQRIRKENIIKSTVIS